MPSHLLPSVCLAVILCFAGFSHASLPEFHESKHHVIKKSPYSLVENYKGKHFFDKFEFFTGADPTFGFVQYVNQSYAEQNGLIKASKDRVTIGVDNVNKYDPRGAGRPSVRIQSHKTYTHGLFVLDLNQMPYACGAWPAFWTFGQNWPYNGEIDIIEGVNSNNYNLVSLHTDKGCTTAGADQWGQLVTSNCALGDSHTGCGVLGHGKNNETFGHGFNKANGGVYAMEWTSSYIRAWHFPRHKIPKSLIFGEPDTSKFGKPMANFQGSCDIDKHFKDHTITFDVTFCGGFAGDQYSSSKCPNAAGGYASCLDFVGNNPEAFNNVQWDINDLKVYQLKGSETSYLTAEPTILSSVVPLASSYHPSQLSSLQIPGGGQTGRPKSHSLSVAPTHKSNMPHTPTRTAHKPSKTDHSKSSEKASKTAHSKTTEKPSKSSKTESTSSSTSQTSSYTSSASATNKSKPTTEHSSKASKSHKKTTESSESKKHKSTAHKSSSTSSSQHKITGLPSHSSANSTNFHPHKTLHTTTKRH